SSTASVKPESQTAKATQRNSLKSKTNGQSAKTQPDQPGLTKPIQPCFQTNQPSSLSQPVRPGAAAVSMAGL
ncbi:hypothetical protein, partial [Aureimonas altamirensis]|uniref:hypothetical protein n=1 Tax=Aureimonas altamirensis TaxID=370622 RepID=UPI001AEC2164